MIPQFLISNIDAVITTFFGLFFTIYALRKRESLTRSSNGLTRSLPILTPAVLASGLIQFFISGNATDPVAAWRIVQTDDGIAQVEFPTTPTRTEEIHRAGDIEVHSVSHVANLAGGKLNLRLGFSEFPPGSEGLSDADRIAGMSEFFVQGGFEIVEDTQLKDGFWTLIVAKPDSNAKMSIRIRFMPNGVYRALATAMAGHHGDPRINRFLNSFSVNERQAEDVME